MEPSDKARKLKHISLLILSALDVITGILSLIITALSIQVIALVASGATLFKAVKIAVQSEKTAVFVKPAAIYAVRTITRSEKMKKFFSKVKEDVKNNPVTLTASVVELAICGGLGYVLLDFVDRFSWAVGWKAYMLAFGAALVVYAALLVMTVYLGHDSTFFASIRRIVKKIGGEKAISVLDGAEAEVEAAIEAAKKAEEARLEAEAKIAEQKAKDDEIFAKIIEEEERKKEAERRAKIEAYKAAHPELR